MLRNTVAILFLEASGTSHVVHIDLAATAAPYVPTIDWDAGFAVAGQQFAKSIIAPELAPVIHLLRAKLSRAELLALRPMIAAKALPIWEREQGELTIADIDEVLHSTTRLSPQLHARVLQLWHTWLNDR
jgi:hypothetical protein